MKKESVESASTEKISALEACRIEHLLGQVKVGEYYSVPVAAVEGEDSGDAANVAPLYFQLVDTAHAHHRLNLLRTIYTSTELQTTAALAFQVQYLRPTGSSDDTEPATDRIEVFADADIEWVKPLSLATFAVFAKSLMRYGTVVPSANGACLYLSDGALASVNIPILDPRCPVLKILQYLKNQGWRAVEQVVVHQLDSPRLYDSKEATKYRRYFQCLCVVDKVMPLTSCLPSRQAVGYYKLLLKGQRAEPYHSAKDYRQALRDIHDDTDDEALALLDEGTGCLADASDEDGIICPGERADAMLKASTGRSEDVKIVRPAPGVTSGGGDGGDGDGVVDHSTGCEGLAPSGSAAPPAAPAAGHGDGIVVAGGPDDPDEIVVGGGTGMVALELPDLSRHQMVCDSLFPGLSIVYDEFVNAKTGEPYSNYTIYCSGGRASCGAKCHKTKGRTELNVERFGELGIIAFLHCWILMESQKDKTHAQSNPKLAVVLAFRDSHVAELQTLFDTVTHSP